MGLCKYCGKEYSSKVLKIHQKICKEREDIKEVKVEEDLFNLTNKVLKEMCEERELPIYGTKKELVERLGD